MIDFHTHTFPDKIARTAISKLEIASHTPAFTDGTRRALIDSMACAGIDWSVVLPVATNPLKVASMNDVSLQLDGQDGLRYFGCMHPDAPDWYKELGRIAQSGLKGIKLHPVYQGIDVDDPRCLRILNRAGELGLTVVIHAGDDIGFPGVNRVSPAMIANALRQVGPVKLVCAHMGGWKRWEEVPDALLNTSALLDTAFALGSIIPSREGDFTLEERQLLSEEAFCSLVHVFGSHRILFGTDSPWTHQTDSIRMFQALPLNDEEKADILHRNAARLIGID